MDGLKYRKELLDELGKTLMGVDGAEIEQAVQEIVNAGRIFFAGAGRAGLMMRAIAMRLMHLGYTCYVVGDVTTPSIQRGDLLIAASGKAETKTSSYYVDVAKSTGAKTLVITANPDGTVAKKADNVLVLIAPRFRGDSDPVRHSVQPMGNRFEQSVLLVGDYIVKLIKEKSNLDVHVMYENHATLE